MAAVQAGMVRFYVDGSGGAGYEILNNPTTIKQTQRHILRNRSTINGEVAVECYDRKVRNFRLLAGGSVSQTLQALQAAGEGLEAVAGGGAGVRAGGEDGQRDEAGGGGQGGGVERLAHGKVRRGGPRGGRGGGLSGADAERRVDRRGRRRRGAQSRGGGFTSTLRSPLCSGGLTMPAASMASIRRAARL